MDDLTFGHARRRRHMRRLLHELDRLDADRRTNGPIPERVRTVLVVLGTAGLVTGAVVLTHGSPLGRPPDVTAGLGSFRFTEHQPGHSDRPVAYDPCQPIEILVNDSKAPDGSDHLFQDALDEVSAATGLVLHVKDRTDDQIRSYGQSGRFNFVLVDWTSPQDEPGLAGDVAGLGGSTAVDEGAGGRHYVGGTVALDTPALAEILGHPDGDAHVEAIIMHELGHLVGLDHVDDPDELMYHDNLGLTEFGPGDREGLAKLGSGRCFPGP